VIVGLVIVGLVIVGLVIVGLVIVGLVIVGLVIVGLVNATPKYTYKKFYINLSKYDLMNILTE
jgi:hypothetical protein